MKITGIYQIQSKIKPERIYIGSSVDISARWGKHLIALRKQKHENSKVQRHYDKYGESDFIFSVLLGCERVDLIIIEQYFIDSYKPYFNIRIVADSNLGIKKAPHTKEAKQKMSEGNKGKEPWNKGKKNVYSKDALNKMAEKKKGNKATQETKDKMRKRAIESNFAANLPNNKGVKYSDERKQQCKDVWVKRKLDTINNN